MLKERNKLHHSINNLKISKKRSSKSKIKMKKSFRRYIRNIISKKKVRKPRRMSQRPCLLFTMKNKKNLWLLPLIILAINRIKANMTLKWIKKPQGRVRRTIIKTKFKVSIIVCSIEEPKILNNINRCNPIALSPQAIRVSQCIRLSNCLHLKLWAIFREVRITTSPSMKTAFLSINSTV